MIRPWSEQPDMNAIRIDVTVNEAIAQALPALRPLLGRRVEIIALDAEQAATPSRKLTLDEFRASRLERPEGVAPVTLEDMERAIVEGALGHAVPPPVDGRS
jgi:hypothetical protein